MVLVDINKDALDLLVLRMVPGDESINDVIIRDSVKYVMGVRGIGERIELSDRARDLVVREAFNGDYL